MKNKIFALILILLLVVNMLLFALRLIRPLIFWSIIIGIALVVYFQFSKKENKK